MLQTYGIADFVDRQKYQIGAGYCLSNCCQTQGKIEVNC